MRSMGARSEEANAIFILPTPPKGEYELDDVGHVAHVNTTSIIEHDGNHWRKILTIMAKLCAPDSNWRDYRDTQLLQKNERIEFLLPSEFDEETAYFICGGAMQLKVNFEANQLTYINEKKTIGVYQNRIFCPYLDYRPYPNVDIEATRSYYLNLGLFNNIDESVIYT